MNTAVSPVDSRREARFIIGYALIIPLMIGWSPLFYQVWSVPLGERPTGIQILTNLISFVVVVSIAYRYTPFLSWVDTSIQRALVARRNAVVRIAGLGVKPVHWICVFAVVLAVTSFSVVQAWATWFSPSARGLMDARTAALRVDPAFLGASVSLERSKLLIGVRPYPLSPQLAKQLGYEDPAMILRYELTPQDQGQSEIITRDVRAFLNGEVPSASIAIGERSELEDRGFSSLIGVFSSVTSIGMLGLHALSPLGFGVTLLLHFIFITSLAGAKNAVSRIDIVMIGTPLMLLLSLQPVLWVWIC